MSFHASGERPPYDQVLLDIADYVCSYTIESELAYSTARNCLIDTLGCGLEALEYPACTKLLGPVVPGTVVPNGAKVPGTAFQLDPVQAAFNLGAMIRWLDFNDTWLAAEWGHPSDNLGGILTVADWLSRTAIAAGQAPPTMRAVLTAMIKAHEIQGCLALENSFNKVGLDHVVLVKVASTAVVAQMLGLTHGQILDALSPGAEHRLAQELGGRRCYQPRRSSRSHGPSGRDGLSLRAYRQGLGVLRCALSRPAVQLPAALRLLCNGECSLQD